MSSEITMVATQYRLQEWAAQIKDCQSRPADMSVADWCVCHGITKANYYYRLRRVRTACLESLSTEVLPQQMVPVKEELLKLDKKAHNVPTSGLELSIKEVCIHVTESTSMHLLEKVLEVVGHAQ